MPKCMPTMDRFWEKVQKTDTCWLWIAGTVAGSPDLKNGPRYGVFWVDGAAKRAHRWIYGEMVETLDPELVIDHLCRVTLCVRPSHLEQVTNRENILRGTNPPAVQARMTHCKHGHEFTDENTKIRRDGKRRCIACYRASYRKAAA